MLRKSNIVSRDWPKERRGRHAGQPKPACYKRLTRRTAVWHDKTQVQLAMPALQLVVLLDGHLTEKRARRTMLFGLQSLDGCTQRGKTGFCRRVRRRYDFLGRILGQLEAGRHWIGQHELAKHAAEDAKIPGDLKLHAVDG